MGMRPRQEHFTSYLTNTCAVPNETPPFSLKFFGPYFLLKKNLLTISLLPWEKVAQPDEGEKMSEGRLPAGACR